MAVPAAFAYGHTPRARLWLRKELAAELDFAAWLRDGEAELQARVGSVVGKGRGAVRRVQLGGRRGVWKCNRHGGLLAPLSQDRFLGLRRLEEELLLSETLRGQGVPTPEVLVALGARQACFWRQHLVTAEVVGAVTVFAARDDAAAVSGAAQLLDRLFELGFWAPDLHPANMLWEPQARRCWVIDLAKARMLGRPLSPMERATRRQRFARYFAKHAGSVPEPFQGFLAKRLRALRDGAAR